MSSQAKEMVEGMPAAFLPDKAGDTSRRKYAEFLNQRIKPQRLATDG